METSLSEQERGISGFFNSSLPRWEVRAGGVFDLFMVIPEKEQEWLV